MIWRNPAGIGGLFIGGEHSVGKQSQGWAAAKQGTYMHTIIGLGRQEVKTQTLCLVHVFTIVASVLGKSKICWFIILLCSIERRIA